MDRDATCHYIQVLGPHEATPALSKMTVGDLYWELDIPYPAAAKKTLPRNIEEIFMVIAVVVETILFSPPFCLQSLFFFWCFVHIYLSIDR